jgi:hypothetical protein
MKRFIATVMTIAAMATGANASSAPFDADTFVYLMFHMAPPSLSSRQEFDAWVQQRIVSYCRKQAQEVSPSNRFMAYVDQGTGVYRYQGTSAQKFTFEECVAEIDGAMDRFARALRQK